MKLSVIWTCVLAVLLWTGAQALAQGKGQGKEQRQRPSRTEQAGAAEAAKPTEVPQVGQAPAGKGKKAIEDASAKVKDEAAKGKKAVEDAAAKGKGDVAKGKKAEQAADAAAKGKGKGKDKLQQAQAFDKQLRHEQAKHMERQARLTRIRELAVQKGDTETVARVDKLIAKEQQVFGRKQLRLQGQKRAVEQPPVEGQQAPVAPTAPVTPPTEVTVPQPAPEANAPAQ